VFINYATEDAAFAEWLTLKLSGEGYKVWCDRVQLLGGESYPKDIDGAIRDRTFRLLALVSAHSKAKDSPLKERILALNLGRERKQELVIPLNVDGLHAADLPWELQDLTYIPFHGSWAAGLAQLLKKLDSVGTPRAFEPARDSVRQFMRERGRLSGRPERLWANLLEITEIPDTVLRITTADALPDNAALSWTFWRENDRVAWSFEGPPPAIEVDEIEELDWRRSGKDGDRRTARDMVTTLLHEALRRHCLAKGLAESADRKYLYFPTDLVPANRLRFTSYDESKTWVNAVGERSAWTGLGTEKFRYHLALEFRPAVDRWSVPAIQVRNRVYLTDLGAVPLEGVKLNRRRKVLCKDWWNHEWLSRLLGSVQWLGDESGKIVLTQRALLRLAVSAQPLEIQAPDGIDEAAADAPIVIDEAAPIDEVNVPAWLAAPEEDAPDA